MSRSRVRIRESLATLGFVLGGFALAALVMVMAYAVVAYTLPILLGLS